MLRVKGCEHPRRMPVKYEDRLLVKHIEQERNKFIHSFCRAGAQTLSLGMACAFLAHVVLGSAKTH